MSVVKVVEVLAESQKSWEDAAQVALARASKTIRNICIKAMEAKVEGDRITRYRINAKLSFDLE